MKSLSFVQIIGLVTLLLTTACKSSYFGKSYPPTQNVDVYYEVNDVKKEYSVMGTSDIPQGFSSMDALQQKVIDLGKSKGADGVIMRITEEVTGSTKSDFGTVKDGKKNNTYSGGSVSTNTKVKKIQATFIKYN